MDSVPTHEDLQMMVYELQGRLEAANTSKEWEVNHLKEELEASRRESLEWKRLYEAALRENTEKASTIAKFSNEMNEKSYEIAKLNDELETLQAFCKNFEESEAKNNELLKKVAELEEKAASNRPCTEDVQKFIETQDEQIAELTQSLKAFHEGLAVSKDKKEYCPFESTQERRMSLLGDNDLIYAPKSVKKGVNTLRVQEFPPLSR